MLYVTVGEMEQFDGDIDNVFYGNYEEAWFEDEFVKRMVREADSSEAVFEDTGRTIHRLLLIDFANPHKYWIYLYFPFYITAYK